jgi:hypothetical protein
MVLAQLFWIFHVVIAVVAKRAGIPIAADALWDAILPRTEVR